MGKLINVNQDEFKEVINSEEGVVLVDFWAEWCGPCRMLSPILEGVSEDIENSVILKINVDDNSEVSAEYGIRNIPAVFVFKGGEVVEKIIGLKSKSDYTSAIEKNS